MVKRHTLRAAERWIARERRVHLLRARRPAGERHRLGAGDTEEWTYHVSLRHRTPRTQDQDYDFDIDSNGKWVVYKCGSGTTCTKLQDYTPNAAIHSGLRASNTLMVRALGSHFDFFVNGTQVGQVDDTSYTSGMVGLSSGDSIEAVFSNLVISRAIA